RVEKPKKKKKKGWLGLWEHKNLHAILFGEIFWGEISKSGQVLCWTGKIKDEKRGRVSPAREMRGSGCG
ncbi:hypothetical protein KCA24_33850, partial [Escherichia coli]|nr:hypothetical protein [Escherichia coli]